MSEQKPGSKQSQTTFSKKGCSKRNILALAVAAVIVILVVVVMVLAILLARREEDKVERKEEQAGTSCTLTPDQHLVEGTGLYFPERPLTKQEAEKHVFNRTTHLLYRLANPPFPDDIGRDADIVFESQSSGNLTSISYAKIGGQCGVFIWDFEPVLEEGDMAVYTWPGPFLVTNEGVTISFFTDNPEDYIFVFYCLNREKETIREGRRYCDAPYEILFLVYSFPPNQVRWCAAEEELWRKYHMTFSNQFMRYNPIGSRRSRGWNQTKTRKDMALSAMSMISALADKEFVLSLHHKLHVVHIKESVEETVHDGDGVVSVLEYESFQPIASNNDDN